MASSGLDLKSISCLFTQDILHQVVRQICIQNDTKGSDIVDHSVNFASSKGDGYLGVVYRIHVKLSGGSTLNIIGKGMPPNLVRRKTFECETFFAKEVLFYDSILPALREFESKQRGREACLSDTFLAVPECYYAMTDGHNDFLVLEDLVEDGYLMAERASGLGLTQTISLLKVVARYHALSFAMKSLEPETFKKISSNIQEPMYCLEQEWRLAKYTHNLSQLVYRAVKDELNNTKYLSKYEKFTDEKKLFKNLISTVKLIEPAVIGHGDCWASNFMFKNTENILLAKAIDFQLVRYGSPVLDLSLFVFCCTTAKQREEAGGVEGILRSYHCELTSAVSALAAPSSHISWKELWRHWCLVGAFGLGCAIEMVPLSLVSDDEVQDLDWQEGAEASTLEELTQFNEVTDPQGKTRLADLIRLAVYQNMI